MGECWRKTTLPIHLLMSTDIPRQGNVASDKELDNRFLGQGWDNGTSNETGTRCCAVVSLKTIRPHIYTPITRWDIELKKKLTFSKGGLFMQKLKRNYIESKMISSRIELETSSMLSLRDNRLHHETILVCYRNQNESCLLVEVRFT